MDSCSLRERGIVFWDEFSVASENAVLARLPTSPGVYVVRLAEMAPRRRGTSDIAYIGKATNQNGLRGRVRQYFHPGPTQSTNIAMNLRICRVGSALRVGFIVVESVSTARRLESDLLHQFENEHDDLPPYNRRRALDLLSRLGVVE
jgi:excinuclease UvrABC nuclease subunit